MSITKNQKSQDSLPEGLHNALTGKNIFLKTAGCLKEKIVPRHAHLGTYTGHALRGTYAGHEHVGTHTWPSHMWARIPGPRTCGHEHLAIHLGLAHVGTLRPTLWQLCAQAFPVKACMRAGRAGASGMGAFKLHDQGGSSRVAGRHETGMVLASFCQCAAVQGSTGHGRYTCWHIYFVKNENDNHSEKF